MTRIAHTSHRSRKRNWSLVLRSKDAWINELVFLVPHESQLAERLYAFFNCVFVQDDTCCWIGRDEFSLQTHILKNIAKTLITRSCVMQ